MASSAQQTKKTLVGRFHLQSTISFPEGAPQREEYSCDEQHWYACVTYGEEWRAEYECGGCENSECPEHGKFVVPDFDTEGNFA